MNGRQCRGVSPCAALGTGTAEGGALPASDLGIWRWVNKKTMSRTARFRGSRRFGFGPLFRGVEDFFPVEVRLVLWLLSRPSRRRIEAERRLSGL